MYGVKASDLKHVVAMLEASPTYLARRMKLLESRLVGPQKMVLTTSPTAQAERWKAAKHVAEVRLWLQPFETLDRRSRLDWRRSARGWRTCCRSTGLRGARAVRAKTEDRGYSSRSSEAQSFHAAPLCRGRVLYLKGKFIGDDGATRYYQIGPALERRARGSRPPIRCEKASCSSWGKQDASYWFGLIAYRARATIARPSTTSPSEPAPMAYPDGPWTDGARYNLARTYEASGETEQGHPPVRQQRRLARLPRRPAAGEMARRNRRRCVRRKHATESRHGLRITHPGCISRSTALRAAPDTGRRCGSDSSPVRCAATATCTSAAGRSSACRPSTPRGCP